MQNDPIRIFVSSTFRDMIEERNTLMSQTWPQLRSFCRERHVEFVEVDLRWGIAEEQSTRKETLKLCLDEIKACRPFFIGLLGERYGWVPTDDAFTKDLKEEQPWLNNLHGKSVTELEILHGVINNPAMAGRAFFYFRDPDYAKDKGPDFYSDTEELAKKQTELKNKIRKSCAENNIPLTENYSDIDKLAGQILEQLKEVIELKFPKENLHDPLEREALDHEAFAESRRHTYIGRTVYFETLDHHASAQGPPLIILGESGSGKSALLANWIAHWKKEHPEDFIFQHYIGGTADSSGHWKLMTRLMAEIKRWTNDPDEIPRNNDDILRDFPLWLSKARIRSEYKGVRFIVVLDALNQLEDKDHATTMGWLPVQPFIGPLRLIVSSLPGQHLQALEKRNWSTSKVDALTAEERKQMIVDYLGRFSKKLDEHRIDRLVQSKETSNPLYLKILLDELRVTGTHDRLDELLSDYLKSTDIPSLLQKVITRYQRDYEHYRKNLVADSLSLIWASRRGLTESELLQLLKPDNLPQLPIATWAPLRAALEDSLISRGGILNFAHDFLRSAVEKAFLPDLDKIDDYRIILADFFEKQNVDSRNCDELPWLLQQAELFERLRKCLLSINHFVEIEERDEEELRAYWIYLDEERTMGQPYLDSFNNWSSQNGNLQVSTIGYIANSLGIFLTRAALHSEAEPLMRRALEIGEKSFGKEHPSVARGLNNLAQLLKATNRLEEAEPLMRRALEIDERSFGKEHPSVATDLNNLAPLLQDTNRLEEAEPLMRRALEIDERGFGKEHPNVARDLNNLATLLRATNRLAEAEPLMRRALEIVEKSLGKEHPNVATVLSNLALLLMDTNRLAEAEPLMRRTLEIAEKSFGKEHPNVAIVLNNLAQLLRATNRLEEAEPLMRRGVEILIRFSRNTGNNHPHFNIAVENYIGLLQKLGMTKEIILEKLKDTGLQIQ